MNVKNVLNNVNRRQLSSNTQKVAYKLLAAEGEWVKRTQIERVATSAAARVRDLRKKEFGAFKVECATASELNRNGDKYTFFYRINPRTVNSTQLSAVFGI